MRLDMAGSDVAEADGTATVFLPIVPFGERWTVTSLAVKSTSTARPTVTVYRNTVTETQILDTVDRGGNNNATDTVFELEPNDRLVVQWTGADPGAVCTTTGAGTKVTR